MSRVKDLDNKLENSSLQKHCREKHGSEVRKFEMNQIASYRNGSMLRQIMEAFRISNSDSEKKEWNHFQLTDVVLGGRNNRSNSQQDRWGNRIIPIGIIMRKACRRVIADYPLSLINTLDCFGSFSYREKARRGSSEISTSSLVL